MAKPFSKLQTLYTIDELFSDDKWDGFHDVAVMVGFGVLLKEQAMQLFFELPEDIKYLAFQWGMGDTEFRERAYEHLEGVVK